MGMTAPDGVAAIETIARECFRGFSALPNARLLDDGKIFGVATDVPIHFFNGIAMSDLRDDQVPEVIESLRSRPFRWWISPSTRPSNLIPILQRHGLRHAYDAPGMMVDFRDAPFDMPLPPGLTIARVTELQDWEQVFMPGFRRPESERGVWQATYAQLERWTHFVGYLDGQPVATTSVLSCGELAGVYHVVTLPAARGRGIGRAMTLEALRHAQTQGATHAALQSSEMGFRVYESVGFVKYCDLTLYAWQP
jgi:ribosomal protein S18 acetylase RimI-like enzyme